MRREYGCLHKFIEFWHNHDERENTPVKDGYTAERTTRPLSKIPVESWMNRLDKWAHERNFECRTREGTLSLEVQDWRPSQQDERAPVIGIANYLDHTALNQPETSRRIARRTILPENLVGRLATGKSCRPMTAATQAARWWC